MTIEGWDAFMQATQELAGASGGGGVSGGGASSPSGGAPAAGSGMTPAQRFSAQPDAYRFDNMDSRPAADPGMAWAEDGTQVPTDYWG